jgi:DNA-binding NarL/FixJ family response regulator
MTNARPRALAGIRVLICDDYQPIRLMLRTIIENQPGLDVVGEAANGQESISEAARLQPDVILLDLAMPVKTGLEALGEIAHVAPAAKIIVFSGFSIASVGGDVIELGAVLYLSKGASPEAIIASIQTAGATPATTQRASLRR